ncbi:hypothetical protein CLIM01_14938, partial [Colletotrichum limetticola]
AFLDDEDEEQPPVAQNDNNNYALGRIGNHCVVIAVLPDGEYGTNAAAAVARDMLHSFPNVRIGLMVGIGGGAPSPKHDVRLGDIVVSSRDGGKGGVFQYDFGKAIQNRDIPFEHTNFLNQPPTVLRTAVSVLKNSSERCGSICDSDLTHLMNRSKRGGHDDDPAVHYGLIASANQLMKDANIRDKLSEKHGVLCFEMEAAGLMNHFLCLVVRGICDYSDSHKNKEWQGFAAMTAAAYATDLLRQIPPNKVEAEKPIGEVLGRVQKDLSSIHEDVIGTKTAVIASRNEQHVEKLHRWLSPADPSTNATRARERRHAGTGTWLLESAGFLLSTTILDHLEKTGAHPTLRFFFDFNDTRKQTLDDLLRSLAFQLYHKETEATKVLDRLFTSSDDGRRQPDVNALSACVESMLQSSLRITVVLDALDECTTRDKLLSWVRRLSSSSNTKKTKLVVTGRPEAEFQREIPRLFGEDNCMLLSKEAVNADIRSYVGHELHQRPDFKEKKIPHDLLDQIRSQVGDGADGMFLIDKDADVNAQGGHYGSALQAASSRGHQEIVQLLLDNGADVNAQGGFYGNALQTASSDGHQKIVELLLDRGADINAQGGHYGSALQAASSRGHQEIGGYFGNALQAASSTGHQEIIQLLLEKDADVNAQGSKYGNALQAASYRGHQEIIRLLLEKDANVNAQGGEYGNALQAASYRGHEQTVRLLFEKDADVNAQGGYFGNALQAASSGGHEEIVQLLLDKGASR